MIMRPGLRSRLMFVNVVAVCAVLISAYFSQDHLAQAQSAADMLSERSIHAIELAAQLETLMHEKSNVSNYLLSNDPQFLNQSQQHYEGVGRWIEGMGQFASTDEEHALVEELRRGYIAYVQQGDKVLNLQQAGHRLEALDTFFSMKREVDSLLLNGQKIFNIEKNALQVSRTATARSIERQRRVMVALIGLGSALSLVMSALLTAYTVRPIYRLVLRLGEASNDVTTVETHDELSVLETRVTGLLARVRAQERKLARTARLTQLGELAAELAHEILNPIAGVKAMLQALRRTPDDATAVQRELGAMERDVVRVETTIRRLMRYARPFEANPQLISVREVCDTALEMAKRTASCSARVFHLEMDETVQNWLLDRDLIVQVLVNLLVNAAEASPPDTSVHLHAQVQQDQLHLQVRDHGHGLSAEAQSRLFHPFFTTKAHGNGLGLAVSRNIIQEHGGRITGSPGPDGSGAVFDIALPRGGL